MSEVESYSRALAAAKQRLEKKSPGAHIDAQTLLCHVLNCNSAHLAAWPEKKLSLLQAQQYKELISLRESGIPVAYLTGLREFWSLELKVTPATLIPRPETEILVEFVLETFADKQQLQLADLGTGSGAIAIAIASERPDWLITATDISADALAIARSNTSKHQLQNIEFKLSNWFEQLAGQRFDIIISNPPYVAEADPHLFTGDVTHEPITALTSGSQGMNDIAVITRHAHRYLNANGWLVLEHGYDQKQRVRDCLNEAGFTQIIQKNDLSKQPRMTAGCIISN